MAEGDEEKTEQPTGKKLADERREGNVIQSQEVKTAAMLLTILVAVWMFIPYMMSHLRGMLAGLIENSFSIRVGTEKELVGLTGDILVRLGLVMAPLFALFIVVGVTASVGQVGWMVSWAKLAPNLGKLNPLAGLKRIFSVRSVIELGKSIIKLIVVGTILTLLTMPRLKELEHLPGMELMQILAYLHSVIIRLLFAVVLIVVALAIADYAYQYYAFMKKMKMSRQDVKDENKNAEGDPIVKSRLRALRMQRARQRMMAAVPKADVIVTNPTHYACALKYDSATMGAPVLLAKGKDLIALRIRQVAEENEIPI
ncbi:MAG TPA: flagellar type III secretion system protein FlhB, partial [Patescibacteria group bacterium]|nr:flagellar type III secretion system protein FlhB [Patescibacteria group bacterium]